MALSGREVLLVLRARDEASRTLRRVSSTMSHMDREAAASSVRAIETQRGALSNLTRQAGDVQYAYSKAATNAKVLHDVKMDQVNQGMVELRRRTDDVQRAYQYTTIQSQKLRADGKITAEQASKQMRDARTMRMQGLQAIQKERYALEDTGNAAKRMYAQQITDARKLRVEQMEGLRQAKQQSQDEIAMHKQRIAAIEEESRKLHDRGQKLLQNGAAAVTAGAAMVGMGALGVRAIESNIQAAVTWDKAVRTTFTQVDVAGAKLRDLDKIGQEVGRTIPVALEEIQPALYDIFSSIDTNLEGGRKLLKQFAKDSVGGQTDMATATRANIAIMNAYNIKAKDSAKVSDFMFRLVQKGVGTYTQFANVIGRSIPSARRAGQTYQTLGGMMVFMTRNGMSAAMASTSAARALDAISNSKTGDKLHEMGIEVRNAKGEFRALPAILDDMNKKFGKMTAPDRAKALQDLFKSSGGTIQARRFFDMYFKNADKFNQFTKQMYDSTGQAQKAFEKLNKSPAAQLQNLKNQWQLMQIQMGTQLFPLLIKFAGIIQNVVKWFSDLPGPVKKGIAIFGVLITTLLLVVGTITILGGGVMMFVGFMNIMGVSAAGAAVKIGLVTGGLTMLVSGMMLAGSSTDKTTKAMGVLSGVMGGAMLGSVIPGVGTAIGAVVGGMLGLASATMGASKSTRDATGDWKDLIQTLDDVTAATGEATRKMVLDKVTRSGALGVLQSYGYANRQVVNAIVNGGPARAKMIAQLKEEKQSYIDEHNAIAAKNGLSSKELHNYDVGHQKRWQAVQDALTEMGAIDKAVASKQRDIAAVKQYGHSLDALPNKKEVIVRTNGIIPSIKGIATMAQKIHATPKEIKVLIEAAGLKPTEKNIERVKNLVKDAKKVKGGPVLDVDARQAKNRVSTASEELAKLWHVGINKASNVKMNTSPLETSMRKGTSAAKHIASTGGVQIGSNLKSGILLGFAGTADLLAAQASTAVTSAIAAARHAADAHSPSRKMYQLGKDLIDGLVNGLSDNTPSLSGIVDKIGKSMNRDFTKKLRHRVTNIARGPVKELQGVSKQLQKLKTQIDDAQSKLDDIKSQRQSYVDNISQGIQSFGGLSTTPTQDVFGNDVSPSVGTVIGNLTDKLSQIREYGKNLQKLRDMGFSKAVVDQVLQMGPEQGALYAKALINAVPSEVGQINSMTSGISQAASTIANRAGDEMYAAGIAAAQGLLNGLKSKEDALIAEARAIATAMVRAIKRALKIKSPSKVGHGLGANFGLSIGSGVASQVRTVRASSRDIARAMIFDPAAVNVPYASVVGSNGLNPVASSAQPSGGGNVIFEKGSVVTQEIDPRKHAADLGFELLSRTGG